MAINADSPKAEAAADFINWCVSEEGAQAIAKTGTFPACGSAATAEIIKSTEVVDAHTVKVFGDGDGLVCIAQPYLGGFLFHHHSLCGRGADGLCVGHQVYKGVAAGGSGAAAGLDVLLVLKARGAPVAVQVHKGGQHGQPSGVEDGLPFLCQSR